MSESILRNVLLVAVVLQSIAGLFCIRRSRAAASMFCRREEGVALSLVLGMLYLAYCGSIVAYLIEPAWMAWGSVDELPVWFRSIGTGPLVAGAVLIVWGLRTLGQHFAFSVSPQGGSTLVTSGPFRWVRHPLYTAFAIEAAGIALMMANWFVGLMAALLWGLLVYRTCIEEEKLIERFGDEYRKYVAITGRFLPRIRSRAKAG